MGTISLNPLNPLTSLDSLSPMVALDSLGPLATLYSLSPLTTLASLNPLDSLEPNKATSTLCSHDAFDFTHDCMMVDATGRFFIVWIIGLRIIVTDIQKSIEMYPVFLRHHTGDDSLIRDLGQVSIKGIEALVKIETPVS